MFQHVEHKQNIDDGLLAKQNIFANILLPVNKCFVLYVESST